jgi:hypothetical protein
LDAERVSEQEKGQASPQDKMRRSVFGDFCFDDLEQQPSPRLFSTHLFGADFLPQQLVDPSGKGRLLIVLRNLKDTLASLHFFKGEAKDGWMGNEHGPGSLARFIDPDCPNAYGSSMDWIIQNDHLYSQLVSSGRVLVVYFEALKADLPAQLSVLHSFLGLGPLSGPKCEAIQKEVGFQAMKEVFGTAKGAVSSLLRKGEVGDWHNHMTEEAWSQLDEVFETKLGQVAIAAPLRKYH